MARILGVGIATWDIVNVVERYPDEDQEVRAVAQHVRRGGNATNTLVVLSQLGHACSWVGTLADDADAGPILADLTRHRVATDACRRIPGGKVPTSYITLSRATGTRTIVHHRDLPEYGFDDFARLALEHWDWLHFEGRNVEETRRMMVHAQAGMRRPTISLEVEKPRPGIEALFEAADTLLFSRVYAEAAGFPEPESFLNWAATRAPRAVIFLGWGAAGAYARDRDGSTHGTPAFPPPAVVDTIGAGDAFNAGVIDGVLAGRELGQTLRQAARLAGRKCGLEGLTGLGRAALEGDTAA